MHAWTRLKMDCPRTDANGLRSIKYALVKFLFLIGAESTTDFNCSQDKTLKGRRSGERGGGDCISTTVFGHTLI